MSPLLFVSEKDLYLLEDDDELEGKESLKEEYAASSSSSAAIFCLLHHVQVDVRESLELPLDKRGESPVAMATTTSALIMLCKNLYFQNEDG